MTVVFSETFTGTNGDSWDSNKWTTGALSSGVVDIQGNGGRMQAAGANYTSCRALADGTSGMSSIGDQRVTGTFQLADASEQYAQIYLRHDGGWGTGPVADNAYWIEIRPIQFELTLFKNVSGSASTLQTQTSRADYSTDLHHFIFECTGTTIRAKVWNDSDSEPGSWDVSVTDTSHSSGILGFGQYNGGATTARTVTFDDIEVDNLTSGILLPMMMQHGG